jgi:hypothetical protein
VTDKNSLFTVLVSWAIEHQFANLKEQMPAKFLLELYKESSTLDAS